MDKKNKSALLEAKDYLKEAEVFLTHEQPNSNKGKLLTGALENILKQIPVKVRMVGMQK